MTIQLHTRLHLTRVIRGLLHVYICFFEKNTDEHIQTQARQKIMMLKKTKIFQLGNAS